MDTQRLLTGLWLCLRMIQGTLWVYVDVSRGGEDTLKWANNTVTSWLVGLVSLASLSRSLYWAWFSETLAPYTLKIVGNEGVKA